jgi:soluble cytochrome b562
MAVALLFKLPALPNCPAIFWPTASASLRFYCAQLAANKDTVDDLLEAIALVNGLPKDHPLRAEINRSIEQWSLEILKLAEQSFQAGKLDEAIATARKIPTGVPAYGLVKARIDRWQSIWSEAEEIYRKAEGELRQSRWHEAFLKAVELTKLGNTYWATTKYDELIDLIHTAQEESAKLDKAYRLLRRGGLKNLLEAIKLAQQLGSKSYAYKEAQDLIAKCADKLIDIAQERLDNGDWQGVLEITKNIPASVKLQVEAQDLIDLANAQSRADAGTVADLEEAISLAQKLQQGRPLYNKAQQFIARWQLEIQDVAHLQRARYFAQSGLVKDLRIAIAEAQLIPSSNPRGSEARDQIITWVRQIETTEDGPFLQRAEQLANFGTVTSLQDAVEQASVIRRGRVLYPEAQSKIRQWTGKVQRLQDQPYLDQADAQAMAGNLSSAVAAAQQIRPGRVLYQEAQSKIQRWTDRIQRLQDQPYLDQADAQAMAGNLSSAVAVAQQIRPGRVLYREAQSKIRQWSRQVERLQDQPYLDQAEIQADAGNLGGAVATAQQIRSGRVLYGEAQARIRTWKREIQGQQNLQSAYQLANPGTPEALAAAMRTASQVPASSKARGEAKDAMNRWSNQLLAMAQERAGSDLQGAIAIAKTIPSGTAAYESAQLEIQTWQNSLAPSSPL